MRILILDGLPCLYPDDIDSVEEFVDYVNENFSSFIPMTELVTDECVPPYFVQEDTRVRYINMSLINSISEAEGVLLPRYDYDERLKELQQQICIHCKNYSKNPDPDADNLDGHRDEMRLDGFCSGFTPLDDYDEDDDY